MSPWTDEWRKKPMPGLLATLNDDHEPEYAPAWRPQPGEGIEGTVVAVSQREGGYGSYPVLTLDTSDGELAVHAFHAVLRNELAEYAPEVGDALAIVYQGKVEGRHGKRYHAYRVAYAAAGDNGGDDA